MSTIDDEIKVKLIRQSYGKHCVRFSKVKRSTTKTTAPNNDADAADDDDVDTKKVDTIVVVHEFIEASVDVELQGNFNAAYTDGDNSTIIATDTIKNTIYVIAADDPLVSIESFAIIVANHFINHYYPTIVDYVIVTVRQKLYKRLNNHDHGFTGNDSSVPTCTVIIDKVNNNNTTTIIGGITDYIIAKTTLSGFSNFHNDEYRTLADTNDRILATSLKAEWTYNNTKNTDIDYNISRTSILDALQVTFLNHFSRSVQETLYKMASSVLVSVPSIDTITLTMPNKHHIPFNLTPFNRTNNNDIFIATSEPYGYITATVSRTP